MAQNNRLQKNVTVTPEQLEYIKLNFDKMGTSGISKMLGISYNKVRNNLSVIGMIPTTKGRVVAMEGYFDSDEFFKHYEV